MSALTPLDLERPPRLSVPRRLLSLTGVVLIVIAWWQVLEAERGVEITTVVSEGVPVDVLVPEGVEAAPGVVVVHGFAGSRQLMRSTALALAGSGMVVAVPDLSGHGANTAPLDRGGGPRVADVLVAADVLADRSEVGEGPFGVLGHSMGSGAAMTAGIEAPERIAAVVAVSPTDAEVTTELPLDLLLLAGEREQPYVDLARDLLERATTDDEGEEVEPSPDAPRRELRIIDGVEHVSILFSPSMHTAAAEWFADSLGQPLVEPVPVVRTIGWWALHLLGVLVLWRSLAPLIVDRGAGARPTGRGVVGAALGALAATVVLAVVGAAVSLDGFGGMLVAPLLAVWLLLAGGVWAWFGPRPSGPDGRDPGWALVLALLLGVGLAALGGRVWLPVVPTGTRAWLLVLYLVAVLPWSVMLATTMQGARGWRAAGWWLLLMVTTTLGLALATATLPALAFLALVLPLLPVLLTVAFVLWLPVQRPWAAGGAVALLLAWLLAILFPLV